MTPAFRHPLLGLGIALAALPFAVRLIGLTEGLATEIAIFAMVGLGFNLLFGYTGLLSFGHGLFFGFAAYAAALAQIHWWPATVLLPLGFATALTAALGAATGFLALRRRGVYFSLLTLAFTALAFYVAYRWTSFTGGESGLRGVGRAVWLGWALDDQRIYYAVTAAVVFAVAGVARRVVRSPFGSVLLAIRENEQRASFAGYPVGRYKWLAFTLSAAITGLGGALFAFLKYIVSADTLHVAFSGEIVAMTIIGGTGRFLGPTLGAAFFILFRELLSGYTVTWQFWFGLLFMAFILWSPAGLVGLGERLMRPFRRAREREAAMAGRLSPRPGAEVPAFLRGHPRAVGPLLRTTPVVKTFDDFRAVDGAAIAVADRTLHALIGPNGAGKTTLFNVVSGLYAPESGTVHLDGARLDGLSPDRVTARGLARSFQITNLFPALSVLENLRLAVQARDPARFHPWRPAASLATVNAETAALVAFLGLQGVEDAAVADLSYGGQRLVEMGVALAARPRMLLLDEPLAGLAAAERERITALIRALTEHVTVLMVEHDIDRVFALADRVTVMNEGRVLAEGSAAEVRAHSEVQRVYLGTGVRRATPALAAREAGAPHLELAGVNTFYGKSHILHDVSLVVHRGEVTALLGRNGAGKSSTFKTILGLVPPRSGSIRFDGVEIAGATPEHVARAGIGLVPQGRRLFSGLTVEENLRLGALRRRRGPGVRWDRERTFDYFPQLRRKLGVKADALSGGEQQMVAIARALSGTVTLLLLDEPFEGLSPAMVEEVYRSLEQLRRDVAILVVEHHLDLVLSLADRAYVLDRGRIAHTGPAAPLLTDLEFRRKVLWL
jgi:ABC-type branched-subunit amino acid transport system ATPase component/ABC-type branched-subunit amino acid transport system permease subunit